MPYINCKICSNEFYAKPNWIKKGHGKYCSKKCQHESQKNGKIIKCFTCDKQAYRPGSDIKKSKSKKYFCGKSCQAIWRNTILNSGLNHSNWKGGERAYRNILIRTKMPQICKKCATNDTRILIVHHLDKDRKNNNPMNLVWLCHNCHHLVHIHNIKI